MISRVFIADLPERLAPVLTQGLECLNWTVTPLDSASNRHYTSDVNWFGSIDVMSRLIDDLSSSKTECRPACIVAIANSRNQDLSWPVETLAQKLAPQTRLNRLILPIDQPSLDSDCVRTTAFLLSNQALIGQTIILEAI